MSQPTIGRIVVYHSPNGDRAAIVAANHGQDGHELTVIWTNHDMDYAKDITELNYNVIATEGHHEGGWTWPVVEAPFGVPYTAELAKHVEPAEPQSSQPVDWSEA
ncbi:MAG: hypothetical protein LC754_10420 [Acidobacteria bacterium]|nr:hypothetical protein [Acidobacteriota bacterium]